MLLAPGTPGTAEMNQRFQVVPGVPARHGSFGTVRPALDLSTGRRAAIKEIPKVRAGVAEPERQARHERSVRREVANLRHAQGSVRVAELLGVYEDPDSVFLAQGWYEAWRPAAWPPELVRREARELLEAVAHCHDLGVAHCDIKPLNLMLSPQGLRLIDFGASQRCCGHAYGLARRTGTPAYIAAEMWRPGASFGRGVDVWSAGVVLFEALTGRHPFYAEGMSTSELADAICRRAHDWDAGREVPGDARDLVDLLMAKDPVDRPTAREALQHPWVRTPGDSLMSQV